MNPTDIYAELDRLKDRLPRSGTNPREGLDASIHVSPGPNTAYEIQQANDYLRDEYNGGRVILNGGALYTMDRGIVIDSGAGVSLVGNGATLDFLSIGLDSSVALTCGSRAPAKTRKSGYDGSGTNYHQWRSEITGFSMIGLKAGNVGDPTTILGDGILIDQTPGVGLRSPRTILRGVVAEGFRNGYTHRNYAYLTIGYALTIVDAIRGMVFEGGSDQGENTSFFGLAVGNCYEGLVFDAGTDNFNVTFAGMSCDYNGQQVIYRSGNGRVTFLPGCYWEFNGAQVRNPIISGSLEDAPPFDFRTAAGNTCMWSFDGNEIVRMNVTPGFEALFEYGNNHWISANDCFGQLMNGNGVTLGSSTAKVLGHRRNGSVGEFRASNWKSWVVSDWPAVVTLDSNKLQNGSFDSTTMLDNWYITAGQGSIAINSAAVHAGPNALEVTITGAASTAKSISVLVPADGLDKVGVNLYAKLDSGSATTKLRIRNVICTNEITPGSEPVTREPEGWAEMSNVTVDTNWTNLFETISTQRFRRKPWATHVRVSLDLTSFGPSVLRIADVNVSNA